MIKQNRDEAKLNYVLTCKNKATLYEKQQTEIFLNYKNNNSTAYWKMIKPRVVKSETQHVSLDDFREHFSQLYITNSSVHIKLDG